jgi:hypothetical protein
LVGRGKQPEVCRFDWTELRLIRPPPLQAQLGAIDDEAQVDLALTKGWRVS